MRRPYPSPPFVCPSYLPRIDGQVPGAESLPGYFYKSFPDPRVLWASPLGYLVGGGPQMLGTMLLAMVADVTLECERLVLGTAPGAGVVTVGPQLPGLGRQQLPGSSRI
jgi:hypothetical protein